MAPRYSEEREGSAYQLSASVTNAYAALAARSQQIIESNTHQIQSFNKIIVELTGQAQNDAAARREEADARKELSLLAQNAPATIKQIVDSVVFLLWHIVGATVIVTLVIVWAVRCTRF